MSAIPSSCACRSRARAPCSASSRSSSVRTPPRSGTRCPSCRWPTPSSPADRRRPAARRKAAARSRGRAARARARAGRGRPRPAAASGSPDSEPARAAARALRNQPHAFHRSVWLGWRRCPGAGVRRSATKARQRDLGETALSDFLTDHGVLVALVCAGLAVAYGLVTTRQLLALSPGNAEMQRISAAVQEGAQAYLNRQYTTIGIAGIVLAIALIFIQDGYVAVGFVLGGVLSGATGYIGMNVSVRANTRVAEAARGGVSPGLDVAFRGGAITGMLVVGLALLGVAGYYGALTAIFDRTQKEAVDALIGLSFGGSLISVFARLGGGIFTKAADVRADLVGKVEAGIPEDDPRNPAVIADNVGDNVGDCAGMAADLFETYAVTAVAVMLLGVLTFVPGDATAAALYPLVLGAVAIVASIIGTFFVRTSTDNVEGALYKGLIASGIIAAILFNPVTKWLMDGVQYRGGIDTPGVGKLYLCALIGIGVTALLFVITDYYTSTRFGPVKKTAAASQTGHATNIISGLAQGFQATALPALVLCLGILGAWKLGGGGTVGIYGIGVAVMGQLSLTGLIVALDAFGPITDNAGGIAEMAELPDEVRTITDRLDAVGNTTKAVTKGYAIGSAGLAALILFDEYTRGLVEAGIPTGFSLANPYVVGGVFFCGLVAVLFSGLPATGRRPGR